MVAEMERAISATENRPQVGSPSLRIPPVIRNPDQTLNYMDIITAIYKLAPPEPNTVPV